MSMEEAPKGTFQDELDWCIQQLETGLLRRNPTPQQASDTQRILQVLRSRKAPFVKKRQVMNKVFGNYRLKMEEERQQQEKTAKNSPQAHIQEVTNPDSRSVAYRKSSKDVQSTSTHWFTPSDNCFTFNFCTDLTDSDGPGSGHAQDSQDKCKDLEDSGHVGALCTGEGSGFSFNFQIPEEATPPPNSEDPKSPETSTEQPNSNHTCSAVTDMVEAPEGSSQTISNLEDAGLSGNRKPTLGQNPVSAKRKKKKSQKKNQTAQTEKKMEEPAAETDKSPLAEEEPQTGADELRRELDWCVEQLEIGLQRQKSTPKQVEEALRAIKTLRGEKVALVKKRQVMRTMFGDYRRKMAEERQKQIRLMQTAAKSARVSQVSATARQKSSKVFRKSGRAAGQDLPATHPDSPGTPSQGFTFHPSQDPFCFNFF